MRKVIEGEKVKVKVCVGILTYNNFALVKTLLETIRYFTKYNEEEYGIVVLDDGSNEEYKLGLRHIIAQNQDWKDNLYLIEHSENQGITKSWNHISNFFDCEYVVLLNNDILVTKYWLTSIIYFLENNKCGGVSLPCWYCPPQFIDPIKQNLDNYEIQIVDPITKEPKRNQPINYIENNNNRPGRVMCPAGMLFGFKKSLFDEVGHFNESTRQFYNETWLGTAFAEKGYSSYTIPFPSCYHIWGHTFANNPELKASDSLNNDRLQYVKKWGGDIHSKDPNNTHRKYMPNVEPNLLKWLSHDIKEVGEGQDLTTEAGTKENQYQETAQDVIDSAKV